LFSVNCLVSTFKTGTFKTGTFKKAGLSQHELPRNFEVISLTDDHRTHLAIDQKIRSVQPQPVSARG